MLDKAGLAVGAFLEDAIANIAGETVYMISMWRSSRVRRHSDKTSPASRCEKLSIAFCTRCGGRIGTRGWAHAQFRSRMAQGTGRRYASTLGRGIPVGILNVLVRRPRRRLGWGIHLTIGFLDNRLVQGVVELMSKCLVSLFHGIEDIVL
jgi:hypothetical protein